MRTNEIIPHLHYICYSVNVLLKSISMSNFSFHTISQKSYKSIQIMMTCESIM